MAGLSEYERPIERPHPILRELDELERRWGEEFVTIEARDERGEGLGTVNAARRRRGLPPLPELSDPGDPLAPARGILVGVAMVVGAALGVVAVLILVGALG